MTFKDGKPYCVIIHDITTLDLARMLANKEDEANSTIWQAIAIAEGLNKASEIMEDSKKKNMAKTLAEMLTQR